MWLANNLAAVNGTATLFVIVAPTHRPFYTSGYGWLDNVPYNVAFLQAHRAAIEPLLQAFAVVLVIVGHVHKYERTCAMLVVGGVPQISRQASKSKSNSNSTSKSKSKSNSNSNSNSKSKSNSSSNSTGPCTWLSAQRVRRLSAPPSAPFNHIF